MKKFLHIFLIVLGTCFLAVSFSQADDSPRGCMGMKAMKKKMEMYDKMDMEDKFYAKIMFIMMNAEEIGLSEDQMDKIHAAKIKLKKSIAGNEADIEIISIDIRSLLMKDTIDVTSIDKLIDQKYEIKKQMAKNIIAAFAEVKNVLTAEQSKTLKDKFMKHMSGAMKMMLGGGKCQMCPMHSGSSMEAGPAEEAE